MSSALAAATEQKKSRAKSVPEFEPEQPQLQHSTGASAGLPRFMRAASGTEDGAAIQFKCAKCQEEEEKSALPVVQAKCACCGGGSCNHDHPEPAGLRHTAREGVADANRPLPHFDRIQTSFGRHDVSEARAQVGGPAARANESMGSLAYAAGGRVAFRDEPDLKLAAHEAAHLVQQRSGAKLAGGVGRPGDPYEQQADAVADAVHRGESAEPLLDRSAGEDSSGSSPVVQHSLTVNARRSFELPSAREHVAAVSHTEANSPAGEAKPSSVAKAAGAKGSEQAKEPVPAVPGQPAPATAGGVEAQTDGAGFDPHCYNADYDEPSDDDEDTEPPEPETTKPKEEVHPDLPRPNETDSCPIETAINAQAPRPGSKAPAAGTPGSAAPPAHTAHATLAESHLPAPQTTASKLQSNAKVAASRPSPLEEAVAQAEGGRDNAVSTYRKSDAKTRSLSTRIAALKSGARFLPEAGSGAGNERTRAAETRLGEFFSVASSHLTEGLALSIGAVPDRLGAAAENIKAGIGSSINLQKSMVSAAAENARAQTRTAAANTRGDVLGGYAATVAAIRKATAAAIHALETAHIQAFASIDRTETSTLDGVNGLYSASYDAHVALGPTYAERAEARGEQYAAFYQTCKRYNADGTPYKDGFFAGYLTNRRAEAEVKAARETANGYRKSLVETANDQAAQAMKGRRKDRCGVISSARRTRAAVDDRLTAIRHALEEGEKNAVAQAASTRRTMLASIESGLSSGLAALDFLEHDARQSLDDTGYLQQLAIEQAAHLSASAVQDSFGQAALNIETGLGHMRSMLALNPAPDPDQMDQVLTQASAGLKSGIDLLLASVEGGTASAEARLQDAGQGAFAALSGDAETTFERIRAQEGAFTSQMQSLASGAASVFATLRHHVTVQSRQTADEGAAGFQQAAQGFTQSCATILGSIKSTLGESEQRLGQEFQKQVRGLDSPQTGIPKQAAVAASKEQPAWKSVLAVVLIIAIIIVVALVIGPAVIGAVGAAAAALGASAGVATAVGAIVGGAIVGALSSGAITVVQNWATGQSLTKGLGRAMLIGAVTGAIGGAVGLGVNAGLNAVLGAGGRLAMSAGAQFAVRAAVNIASDSLMNIGQQMALTGHVDWSEFAQGVAMSLVLHGSRRVQAFQGRMTAAGARGVARGVSAVGVEASPAAARASAHADVLEQHAATATEESQKALDWTRPTAAPKPDAIAAPAQESVEPPAAKTVEAPPPAEIPATPVEVAPPHAEPAPRVPEEHPASAAVREAEPAGAPVAAADPNAVPAITSQPTERTSVGVGEHDLYIRRGPRGVEVGMCSGVCGDLKLRIEQMQTELGSPLSKTYKQLEQLKNKANDLEQRVERGEVTNNQLEREMTDLAARLRIAAEENPKLRQNLESDLPDEATVTRALDIFGTRADLIEERSTSAAPVDESVQEIPSSATMGLRRGESRLISGRTIVSEFEPGQAKAIKQWARAVAREAAAQATARAIGDIGEHTYLTQATVDNLENLGVEFVEGVYESEQFPSEIDFSHDKAVADYPEFAHRGEEVGHGATRSRHIGEIHAGEVSAPLETESPRLNPTQEQFGLHVEFDPEQGGVLRNDPVGGVMRQTRDLAVKLESQADALYRRAIELNNRGQYDRAQKLVKAAAPKAEQALRLRKAMEQLRPLLRAATPETRGIIGREVGQR